MQIKENIPLKDYTTFHIGGSARYFVEASTLDELKEAIAFSAQGGSAFGGARSLPILVLGGGSNVLISDKGFDGIVIKPRFFGFEVNGEKVKIGASENWDECAKKIVEAGLWGIENLSFVPGTAAGLAVQNVGAYGQEAKNTIDSVEVFDTKEQIIKIKNNTECEFGYRRSIFNTTEKGKYIILSVTLKLDKNGTPNTSYGLKSGTLQEMREQVITARKGKGQDPSEYWSAGSFFKNPIVSEEQYAKLPAGTPRYAGEGGVKVPAGYLLDKICNLKGLTVGGAKLSELQVINIINFNNPPNGRAGATAEDVLSLYKKARDIVFEKTGITLVNEPELVGLF